MPSTVSLNDAATDALLDWVDRMEREASDDFNLASRLVKRMGAHVTGDGRAEIGVWAPELRRHGIPPNDVYLEVLTPPPDLDLVEPPPRVSFRRDVVRLRRNGDVLWGVVDGMRPGTRDTVGSFYWVRYRDADGTLHTIRDHLAASVPFGAFAPAELYDLDALQANRGDLDYWANLPEAFLDARSTTGDATTGDATTGDATADGSAPARPQFGPPSHILQLHPGTSSESGTLAGLTRLYRRIAQKIERGASLTPDEKVYAGYDAVQLMPVEPIIEYEAGPDFWTQDGPADPDAEAVTVHLQAPDVTNWGYDIVISASSAVNPVILETKRPDELVDLAATLHTFPTGPIRLIFDIVYGHVDNQALGLLADEFLAGPGMYGMNLDYQHPQVRAILLEMQRRKVNFGADGVRTDGAQDFKFWDPETQSLYHDDLYLQQMSDLVQDVGGTEYHPWMIFEDGRPWPQDDWELSSTYRAVIDRQPDVFQWGPLTFAHNTPFLFTYWISRWWRIQEVTNVGSHWISGCANHDTLRRGAQVDPTERINTFLGDSLPEIIRSAYDNPAGSMLTYGFFPGVPMDFVNAFMQAPWSFIRNTDDRYGVKVVSEEARFLEWRVTPEVFRREEHFTRLKALGFDTLDGLRRFLNALDHAVQLTDYDLPAIVALLEAMQPPLAGPELSVDGLKTMARAWMDDVHDYCNVSHYTHRPSPEQTTFNRALRAFRTEHRWLMDDLGDGEWLRYREPAEGTIVFAGLRRAPDDADSDAQVLFVANMEGAATDVTPADWLPDDLAGDPDAWTVALAAPGVDAGAVDDAVTLANSQCVLFRRTA